MWTPLNIIKIVLAQMIVGMATYSWPLPARLLTMASFWFLFIMTHVDED